MHIVIKLLVWWIYLISHSVVKTSIHVRADSTFAPIQWERALICNDICHWLFSCMSARQRLLITGWGLKGKIWTISHVYMTVANPISQLQWSGISINNTWCYCNTQFSRQHVTLSLYFVFGEMFLEFDLPWIGFETFRFEPFQDISKRWQVNWYFDGNKCTTINATDVQLWIL